MVIVYLLIGGVFCSGTLIAALLQQSLYWTMYQDYPSLAFPLTILVSNPGVGFFSLIDNQLGTNVISNIVRAYHNKNVAMKTLLQFLLYLYVYQQYLLTQSKRKSNFYSKGGEHWNDFENIY